MYFHFGNKDDIALAVLETQQVRMRAVLAASERDPGRALERLVTLIQNLGNLISQDRCVQAGIRLAQQPQTGLELASHKPYFDWVLTADDFITAGIEDGSIRSDLSVNDAAEFLNEVFVGAQMLAGFESQWVTLPDRIERAIPIIKSLLEYPGNASVPFTKSAGMER